MSNFITLGAAHNQEGFQAIISMVNTATGVPTAGLVYADFDSFTRQVDTAAAATFDPTASGVTDLGSGLYGIVDPALLPGDFQTITYSATNGGYQAVPCIVQFNGESYRGTLDSVSGTTIAAPTAATLRANDELRVITGDGSNEDTAVRLVDATTLSAAIPGLDTNAVVAVFPRAETDANASVDTSGLATPADLAGLATSAELAALATSAEVQGVDGNVTAARADIAALDNVVDTLGIAVSNIPTTNPSEPPTAAAIAAAVLSTPMTESYAADGSAPSIQEALLMLQQMLGDFSITGTTLTVRRLNGATPAATFTLNDADAPTSITRTG